MTAGFVEDTEADYGEADYGELFDDSEADGDSEAYSRSAWDQRRARQRRLALARQRQAQARPRYVSRPALPPSRRTDAAIRTLDLETKVNEDAFRARAGALGRRMTRSEYAAVLGVAADQAMESFHAPTNEYARAAVRFAPLLLLAPQKRGTGVEAVITDPRIVGAALIGGITFFGEQRSKTTTARRIDVTGPHRIPLASKDVFLADVLDAHGGVIANATVAWDSSDTSLADIDQKGAVTSNDAGNTGAVVITATAGDVVARARLVVFDPDA